MPTLKDVKKDKILRARIIIVSLILIADILLLPWIAKFPFFLLEDPITGPSNWFRYGIFRSIKDFFTVPLIRNIVLIAQLAVGALILSVVYNPHDIRKKNRIKDGVGGPDPAGQGQHGTSRWQTKTEMDKTSVVWKTSEPLKAGGPIFGMEITKDGKEKVWLDDDDTHTLMVAATRSGKSRKVYLPSIWEIAKSEESMIIGDPKGELYISTKDYLEKQGYKVIALNLREPSKGNQWDMLHLVTEAVDRGDISKATELAWDIANIISHQTPSASSEPIWENGEESTIASLILLTAIDAEFKFQRHMTTAYYLLAEYGQAIEDYVPLLEYIKGLPVRHPAKAAFAIASVAPYKTRASFFTQALADLRLFADSNIQDMTSKQDHSLENISIEKTAVFLIVPDEKATRNVLATLYIDQVYQTLVDLANRNGGRIPRRVHIKLDEFGNLPKIPNFEKKLTVAGGRGIKFTIAVQDIAQLKDLYDKKQQTITGNCQNWIYLSTSDMETAKLISDKTGQYTVETESANSSVQSKGHSFGTGVNLAGRALLMPDEVMRWTGEESLVMRAKQFPARYPLPDLSLWQANKDFGFVDPTGDIKADAAKNNKIIAARWTAIPSREIEEVSIWLPEIECNSEDEEEEKEVKKPTKKKKKEPTENANDVISQIINESSEEKQKIREIKLAHKQSKITSTDKLSNKTIEETLHKAYEEHIEAKTLVEVAATNEIKSSQEKSGVHPGIDIGKDDNQDIDNAEAESITQIDLESILKTAGLKQEQDYDKDDDFL